MSDFDLWRQVFVSALTGTAAVCAEERLATVHESGVADALVAMAEAIADRAVPAVRIRMPPPPERPPATPRPGPGEVHR